MGGLLKLLAMNSLIDRFRDLGGGLSRFTERWVPDSWVVRHGGLGVIVHR